MAKKVQRGLGRGLGALLGDDVESAAAPQPAEQTAVDEVRMLPIHLIDPNREQPRRSFDEGALNDLAQSIRAVGVLQPIIVAQSGERYTIIAGERRYRASRLAEKTDVSVYLGFIPSAAEVWRDKLPAGAESWDQTAFLDRAAEETGLPAVDFAGALTAHADEPIFYRTDHHWTSLGAFYGANAVLSALGRPTLDQADFTPQVVSDDFNGTLYSTSGIHWLTPDEMEYWVEEDGISVTSWRTGSPEPAALYDRSYLEKKDKYSSFLGGNQPLCVLKNEHNPDGGKILLVRDSYSDSLAPFLAQSFSEVHLLDLRYYRAPVAQYAAENGIDEIVVLYSVPNFITDRNLVLLTQ